MWKCVIRKAGEGVSIAFPDRILITWDERRTERKTEREYPEKKMMGLKFVLEKDELCQSDIEYPSNKYPLSSE